VMELVVFDLDGTLLDGNSGISGFTSDTLKRLSDKGIPYTVATGRTRHGASPVLQGHRFHLPHIYKNGVMIWHPQQQRYSSRKTLTPHEFASVMSACEQVGLTPFVFTLDASDNSVTFHRSTTSAADRELIRVLGLDNSIRMRSIDDLPSDAAVTHINAIGQLDQIHSVLRRVENEAHLVAYSGLALEGQGWHWIDVHHGGASKGDALASLKGTMELERIICFGDSDNDLSMFETADECYAPANANDAIKSLATGIIGHHDEDGVARFLRQRFDLA